METAETAEEPLPAQAAASSHEQPQAPVNTGPASPDPLSVPTSSLRMSAPVGTVFPQVTDSERTARVASANADSNMVAVRKVIAHESFKQALHEMTEGRLREVQSQCEIVHSPCEQLLKKAEVAQAKNLDEVGREIVFSREISKRVQEDTQLTAASQLVVQQHMQTAEGSKTSATPSAHHAAASAQAAAISKDTTH